MIKIRHFPESDLTRSIWKAVMMACALLLSAPGAAENWLVPELGTAGSLAITIPRERQLGEYFMRTVRAGRGVIDDPVLTEYLDSLGGRLVSNARNIHFPFEFFLIKDDAMNASAFLGGKIKVNTGLFRYTDTEDELAAVLAHEIIHVTQRHIARFIEARSAHTTLTAAGLIGAIAMSIINPMVGAAAFSTAVGLTAQTSINYTRDNELEADRLGIELLAQAGYNPQGMVEMFRKLEAMQGNVNPALALLRDHPLSGERVAEATLRAHQYAVRQSSTNADFEFAKARITVRCSDRQRLRDLKVGLESGAYPASRLQRHYALALIALEEQNTPAARTHLTALGARLQDNLFVVDALTDADLSEKRYAAALSRLQACHRRMPHNQVITVNLANSYLEAGHSGQARELLTAYLRHNPPQVVPLTLLTDAQQRLGDRCGALQSQGELLELSGNHNQATARFNEALQICDGHLERERIKARVVQIAQQRAFDQNLSQGR